MVGAARCATDAGGKDSKGEFMRRRKFLRLHAVGGPAVLHPPWALLSGTRMANAQSAGSFKGFGHWEVRNDRPAFVYEASLDGVPEWDPLIAPKTKRNWLMVGNQAIRLY